MLEQGLGREMKCSSDIDDTTNLFSGWNAECDGD